jgi:hypothetical protein
MLEAGHVEKIVSAVDRPLASSPGLSEAYAGLATSTSGFASHLSASRPAGSEPAGTIAGLRDSQQYPDR